MSTNDHPPLSLLSGESRGGDINEGGMSFQMAVLLAQLPRWLATEGFTTLIREASGDFEARFYVPGRGYVREFFESKDHPVTPAEFWEEIDRFKKFDYERDREFQWFTLVSAGLSDGVRPVMNGLRRVRDPYGFYDASSPVLRDSYEDFAKQVEKLGRTREDAAFLFTKVRIDPDWASARLRGTGHFKDEVERELPDLAEVPNKTLADIYAALDQLIGASRNAPIERRLLERCLRECLPPCQRIVGPVRMHTSSSDEQPSAARELTFGWKKFFGGVERVYPPSAQWDNELVHQLRETRQWMLDQRDTRRIRLSGERRLSASLAFGFVFSAVGGFAVEEVGRNSALWATDDHAQAATPPHALRATETSAGENEPDLVVGLSFVRDIVPEVSSALSALNLTSAPTLFLHVQNPVVSADQANAIVTAVKNRIVQSVQANHARMVHLFFAGPAFVALLLGHRLNAVAPFQCYEWTGYGYVLSCLLSATAGVV